MQRYSRRKPGSIWSRSNVDRVERLIAEGRMTPAGLALVEEAKQRGAWERPWTDCEPQPAPEELERALREADLWRAFEAIPNSRRNRYVLLVEEAKRPDTRARRVEKVLQELRDRGAP